MVQYYYQILAIKRVARIQEKNGFDAEEYAFCPKRRLTLLNAINIVGNFVNLGATKTKIYE